jgi:uncharacterized protein (DUF362 family)
MSIGRNELQIVYGTDIAAMAGQLLEAIDLPALLADRAAAVGKGPSIRIVLKPNLVVAKPAASGATTHPELAAAVVNCLQRHGYANLAIVEGSWVGDSATRVFQVCGYEALARQYRIPLIDAQKSRYLVLEAAGLKIELAQEIQEADFLISLPVLKGHCQTKLTCALKNMKGCISDRSKRQFHSLGLHRPIALLNGVRSADLVIVDGMCGDLDFEEGGNPVAMNRLIAGRDSVLVDRYAADLLGFPPEDIPCIGLAAQLGVGSADLSRARIVELNANRDSSPISVSGKAARLARQITPLAACSACYGGLIHALARLSEQGFNLRDLGKIQIGQGYKGLCRTGIGIGSCTSGADQNLPGCPPKAIDILRFLERAKPQSP